MIQIIIAERGWIFVGECMRDGDQVIISNARNIRLWGTTEGLGELARRGPLAGTKLDDYGTVRIHVLGVIASLDCDVKAWKHK